MTAFHRLPIILGWAITISHRSQSHLLSPCFHPCPSRGYSLQSGQNHPFKTEAHSSPLLCFPLSSGSPSHSKGNPKSTPWPCRPDKTLLLSLSWLISYCTVTLACLLFRDLARLRPTGPPWLQCSSPMAARLPLYSIRVAAEASLYHREFPWPLYLKPTPIPNCVLSPRPALVSSLAQILRHRPPPRSNTSPTRAGLPLFCSVLFP